MAVCDNCGASNSRVRTTFLEGGGKRDECPHCAPQSFEKVSDPSTKKIWIGPEYRPNAYEKRYDEHGDVYYQAKPEFTADEEARISAGATDEREAREREIAKRRAQRNMKPLKGIELEQAIKRAQAVLGNIAEEVTMREHAARAQAQEFTPTSLPIRYVE